MKIPLMPKYYEPFVRSWMPSGHFGIIRPMTPEELREHFPERVIEEPNAPSSPMAGVNATPEAPSTPQTAQTSNHTAGQPFGAAPLLGDSFNTKKPKSIITNFKEVA